MSSEDTNIQQEVVEPPQPEPSSRSPTPTPTPTGENPVKELETENNNLKRRLASLTNILDDMRDENRELRIKMSKNATNKVITQLWIWVKDCKLKRNAYWKLYYSYQKWNNVLSIPLLLISSATGITSVAQLNNSGASMEWVVAVLGVLSTAFAAFQRYFRYGEKAEQSKGVAKRYALLARKGELHANMFDNNQINMNDIATFMEEFRKELDSLLQETDDVPEEILNRKYITDPLFSDLEIRQMALQESIENGEQPAVIDEHDEENPVAEEIKARLNRMARDAMFAREVQCSKK